MSKWEDTVMGMNSGLVQGLYLKSHQIKEVLEAQAEISFKAGKAQGTFEGVEMCFNQGKKAGRKEVVEWIEGKRQKFFIFDDLYLLPEWRAKLKEWEIE